MRRGVSPGTASMVDPRFMVPTVNLTMVVDAQFGVATTADAAAGEVSREDRGRGGPPYSGHGRSRRAEAEHVAKVTCAIIDSVVPPGGGPSV